MTAHCATTACDEYETYRQWARDHNHQTILTRSQYRAWMDAIHENWAREGYASVAADQREFDREEQEGWAAP